MNTQRERLSAETRFRSVFAHFGAVRAYARRRGSGDPEAVAAEVMAVAWRRLADVPTDDARPWLFATARNLLLAEWRTRPGTEVAGKAGLREPGSGDEGVWIDPEVAGALRSLSVGDREALLLVAWEDLSPRLAARALGISEGAFRVRLHRARRRFRAALTQSLSAESLHAPPAALEMENR
jgi:RNA polymerase sigma-70 factor (ECF subfamily)